MSEQYDDKLNTQDLPTGIRDKPPYTLKKISSKPPSACNHGRVVSFSSHSKTSSATEREEKPSGRTAGKRPSAEIIELPTKSLLSTLKEKLHRLSCRANEYAQQMYQQAEPSPEDLEAERYIPGVDQEEFPDQEEKSKSPRRFSWFHLKPAIPPPDISPADLATRYKKILTGARARLWLCLLCSLVALYPSLNLPLPAMGLEDYHLRLLICVFTLGLTCLLCADIIITGLLSLLTLEPEAEVLCTLSALVTLADGLTMPTLGFRENTLPCTAPSCFILLFALWGRTLKCRGDRLSCRTAAQVKEPYLLTLDQAKWSGRPAYSKWSGPLHGFGSQIQSPDGAQQVCRLAVPLLLLACFVCSLLASVGRGHNQQFLWAFSATLTAAASFSPLLIYALPYHRLTLRLSKEGSTLAGWPGAACCGGVNSLILTDGDLFPPGTVKLNGIKIFGDFSTEKVVAYTATLVRASHSGLDKPFSNLMKAQNALYRPTSGLRFHEGGITGIIRNQEVIVGTAAFLHLMNIALPQGLRVKNALFCAIDGDLAGIFALHYAMHDEVAPCLTALMRSRISPLLATRDPNLLPSLLGQKFKLPVEKMEFPSVERRLELSDPEQSHSQTLTAVLLREGLAPYSDAAVGARRLRSAVRLGSMLWILGAVVGVVLTFYLTFVDAYLSLSPTALLVFLLAWLAPTFFLADWATRY